MKYAALKALVAKLSTLKRINRISRVADSCIKVEFDRENSYCFDLSRGQNLVFKGDIEAKKEYKAPFDSALGKYFSKCSVEKIELSATDKIITVFVASKMGYKEYKSALILELVGKNANAVITGEDGAIIGALRYENGGARELRITKAYAPPPPPPFSFSDIHIDDIDDYLQKLSGEKQKNRLENLKSQKIAQIDKKIEKLEELLASFEESSELFRQAREALRIGDILCANASLVLPHQKSVTLQGFDGEEITIELPEDKSQKEILNYFYTKSKKLRKKADGIYKEKESIGERISFLRAQKNAVASAREEESVKLFAPKQKNIEKKEESNDIFEAFYKDYKISVGKNRKGNEKLLKFARANDLWFHLKDTPSAHVILHTNKQKESEDILRFAAKICVELSTSEGGNYEVDYARRRDVSPKDGANVNYVNYKTLIVKKE